jgi:uncharacterized protein (TIGR03083 family)
VVSTDVWGIIHAERRALAADLQALTDPQWAAPSLCTNWTVRDVLAHMAATARMTPPQFVGNFVMSGFNLASMQSKGIEAEKGRSPAETLARFTTLVSSSNHPPGPTDTWLGEVIVHSEDIRRALGIKHAYPTDADWSHGDGPEVAGPIVSLVMAMTGRAAATDDLAGDGVAPLRSRS